MPPRPTDVPEELLAALPHPEAVELVETDARTEISLPRRHAVQRHSAVALGLVLFFGLVQTLSLGATVFGHLADGRLPPLTTTAVLLALSAVTFGLPGWYAVINLKNRVRVGRDRHGLYVLEGPIRGTIRRTLPGEGLHRVVHEPGVGKTPGRLEAVYADGTRRVLVDRLANDRVGAFLELHLRREVG